MDLKNSVYQKLDYQTIFQWHIHGELSGTVAFLLSVYNPYSSGSQPGVHKISIFVLRSMRGGPQNV